MNKLQASRMLTLAHFLKTGICDSDGVTHYDQSCFFNTSPERVDEMHCGTSACALGWATLIFPDHWTTKRRSGFYIPVLKKNFDYDFNDCDPYDNASEFFGITREEAKNLFGSYFRTAEDVTHMLEKVVDQYGYTYAN